ncbi:MAG: uracil-DNA glycosylase [Candidatus Hydrogenedentes bacterium]|nr:uracil-DNA glycosylase [Candidatus Hydrogenedentota bacterium]
MSVFQKAFVEWYHEMVSKTKPHPGVVLNDLLNDVRELVKQAAHPRKKTVAVSPEVAAMLERIGPSPKPRIVEQGASPEFEALRAEVNQCRKCRLWESRTHAVFGAGNPNADLVFVGEAPGENEDLQGVPFVGRAGRLLTDIIEKGMKMTREDVFICNVLKCRPPGNRDPRPDEKEACEPYLVRQLELIKPMVICALGGHAAKMLLKTDESVGRLRGKWHFYQGIPVRVTYHPAYVVRSEHNPPRYDAEKRRVWEDIQEVLRVLRGEIMPEPEPRPESGTMDLFG